jgi:hypothetical protein
MSSTHTVKLELLILATPKPLGKQSSINVFSNSPVIAFAMIALFRFLRIWDDFWSELR